MKVTKIKLICYQVDGFNNDFILGEPFNMDEFNEMLQACEEFVDPQSPPGEPHILYKFYIDKLVVDDTTAKDK